MKLNKLFYLIFFACLSVQPLLATGQSGEELERTSDLWQAIYQFEQGELDAAAKFRIAAFASRAVADVGQLVVCFASKALLI